LYYNLYFKHFKTLKLLNYYNNYILDNPSRIYEEGFLTYIVIKW